MARLRDLLPLVAWLASLAAGIVLFTQLGDGALAAPPLGEPSAWGAWAAERDGVVAGLALLRLVVLALAWYLVGVTTFGVVARVLRLARFVRVADALSGPLVRHLVRSALGVSLAVGVVAASSGPLPRGADAAPGRPVATAVALDEAPASRTARAVGVEGAVGEAMPTATAAGPGADPTARMVGLDPTATERMVGLPPGVADADGDAAPEVADAPAEVAAGPEHEVAPGEHLWAIAEQAVADALDRTPSDGEVHAYWEELIAANRDRLADPDNPDLIFPGQRLALPDVGPAVGA